MSTFNRNTNLKTSPLYIALLPSLEKTTKFTSGDVVRGTVNVDPVKRPQRVRIHFRGRSKFCNDPSQGNTSATYRKKISFFEHSLELFSSASNGQSYDILGKGVNAEDRVELPFEFVFPDRVELDPPGDFAKEFRDVQGFERGKDFVLPPTYEYPGSSTGEQVVEYFLQADMFTDHRLMVDKTVRQHLQFIPPSPVLPQGEVGYVQTRPMDVVCRTHRLDPEYDPDEGTLSRLRHRMKKNDPSTPMASFKVLALVPKIIPKDSIVKQVTLSLVHKERSDIVKEAPPVYLREIRVRLISTIRVRMPTSKTGYLDGNMYDSHTTKFHLMDRRLEKPNLMYDGMRIHDLGRRNIGETQADYPDFTSYGLALSHGLEVNVSLTCAGEKFEVVAARGPITLISEPISRVMPGMDGSTGPRNAGLGRRGVDEAVVYEELPEYAPPAYTA